MNYGLYMAASGVLTNSYRQDVYANNLANVETVGFKRDIPTIRQRDPATRENPSLGGEFSQRLLEKLGGGALAGQQKINFAPSPLKAGGALDAALEGTNAFFAIGTTDAKSGQKAVRLTRDGRFTLDSKGYLSTIDGNHVLDTSDQPIQISGTEPVEIDTAGHIHQAGETVGQIQVTGVSDLDKLKKQGANLFAWEGKNNIRQPAAVATIRPGYVETSGVDPTTSLLDLINATRDVTTSANLVHYHDMMMDRAINTLGRVA